MQKPQIPIFMEITDAEWDEMVRLLCLREKKFKKNTIILQISSFLSSSWRGVGAEPCV